MKLIFFIIVSIMLSFSPAADACVGKVLNIGVINSPEGQVLAEMLSILINERTGTTLSIRLFKNTQELYEGVKGKQVDLLIENTTKAMHLLNKPVEVDPNKAYQVVKTAYEKEKGLIWLKPFVFSKGTGGEPSSYTATILTVEILNNFPALPRVIDKLGSTMNDEVYAKLMKSVESGEKPKKVAKDFLKSKKLI